MGFYTIRIKNYTISNKKLYNINKKDQILQRLTCHTLELLLYVHLSTSGVARRRKVGGGAHKLFSRKPKKKKNT